MNLYEVLESKTKNNKLAKELVDELKKYDDDIEFLLGVMLDVDNDEDKRALLDYIKYNDDVDYEQILLNSLYLSQQRERSNNEMSING